MDEPKHQHIDIETQLSRELGLTTALAIGVGTMIAAGIFTLSGLAVRNVGSGAVLSFMIAAVVALFTALTYCEFVSIYPNSGEGYLYARKTFPAPLAYFVGWCLMLGYTSSCAFYIASLSSYFHEFVWEAPFQALSGVVFLVLLALLNIKGTKESGGFQVVITVGKVLLLIWFVLGGLPRLDPAILVERFNGDIAKIGSTAAMVFITFFGFSAIAASAGEVKNPVKTIPRAIFISMGLVTVLYTLVVLVVVAAGLQEYSEAAMGTAARQFLGPIGGMVIVLGALFSMISASNASIMAGSRVTLSMSQMNHLPKLVGSVNARTRTPVVAVLLVSGMIMLFALSMPLEDLAHFADTVLLLVLIIVNGALIHHRRKFPDMVRPFRVPWVPVLPALGILANLYLLSQLAHHIVPVILALLCLLIGILGFLFWKGTQPAEDVLPGKPSRVVIGHDAIKEGQFRVLVPLANPATAGQLIDMAAAIAADRDGEIVAMRIALVPEQILPFEEENYVEREREILELAHARATRLNVPISTLVRVGHNAARAILETARERDCDLIIMGWKGYTTTRHRIHGDVTDAVVSHAHADIMLVKLVDDKALKTFLLPSAGGEHARCAEDYLASLIGRENGALTVCRVISPDAAVPVRIESTQTSLDDSIARLGKKGNLAVHSKILQHASVTEAILNEAEQYDAIVVGAAGHRVYAHLLFGGLAEHIAKRSHRAVILVKHYHPVKALLGRVLRE